MNPSDTHIERMAETFAERTPYLRRTKQERVEAWRDALEIAREEGKLDAVEERMRQQRLVDRLAADQWAQAREY